MVASTTALSLVLSTIFATRCSGPVVVGVGRFSFTANSDVTVHGGVVSPRLFIKCTAAAQFEWQSSNAPQMPPFNIPSNAS